MKLSEAELVKEFERQINNLLAKNYPSLAGITQEDFLKFTSELLAKVRDLSVEKIDIEKGTLPFVIVVKLSFVNTQSAMSSVVRDGKTGIEKLYPREACEFLPIESVSIPENPMYLLVDIDRGKNTINIAPREAMTIILKNDRTPLTIDEGIAVVTHFPAFLMKNNCFSLLASRFPGDKRVPAIWINGKKRPNLGWCWDGNPHTWLGSASCKYRV